MTWNLLINLYLRPFFTTDLDRSCVIQIDFWLIHLVPLTLKFAETVCTETPTSHELNHKILKLTSTNNATLFPSAPTFNFTRIALKNLGMAAPPRKTFFGNWMRFSRSSATFTGLTLNSVSISSSVWSSWRVTWLSHVSNAPNNLSNNGSRSRWPSSQLTTLSARKCARWLMWYWMRRTSHLNCVQSMELMW